MFLSNFPFITYADVLFWMEKNMLTCPSKKWLHMDCPGCGMQRSMLAILNGDFVHSFKLYPAAIPLLLLMAYLVVHITFKLKNGARNLTYGFVFCSIIVITNYVYKVITNQIY